MSRYSFLSEYWIFRGERISFGDVSFSEQLLADDIRPSRKDVKVTAVCQSLTNLLRGATYGLRVSASFLRSAPGPAGVGGGVARPQGHGRHSGAGWRLAGGLNNGLGHPPI